MITHRQIACNLLRFFKSGCVAVRRLSSRVTTQI
jgi:hypothetical protein